jgi:hypothetical protein
MQTFKDQRIPKYGFTSADPTSDIPADALITGSYNLMYRGQNELETVGGFKRTSYGGVPNPGGDISMLVGKGWAVIGDTLGEGAGSITEFIGRSLWFTGVGDIIVYNPGITATPQALGNSPSQNFIPQVAVLNQTKTGYTAPFQMGLLKQNTAPVMLVAATGINNKLNGTYSMVMTWLRDATGAESLPSPSSNIAQFSNQTALVTFPTPTNPVNPRDRWRVYGTPSGFGAIGGYFFFQEVPERRVSSESGNGYAVESGTGFNVFRRNPTVTGYFSTEQIGKRLVFYNNVGAVLHTATVASVTTNTFTVKGVTYGDKITFAPAYSGALTNVGDAWSIDAVITDANGRQMFMEWFDNELGAQQPPTDFFPPATTASFIAALGNVIILIGTEDGLGVAVSVPNFPEAFPPDFRMNLSEPPVGVLSRPQDGFLYVVGENSVTELRRTSSDTSPVAPRVVADQVGAANQRAACMAGNAIYLFTKSKVPARILPDGSVDTNFGTRVEAIMKTWNETKVSVSSDERKGYVTYMHGTTMLLYYPAFDYWAPPVDLAKIEQAGKVTGDIISAFTLSGVIHASIFTPTRAAIVSASPGSVVFSDPLAFSAADVNATITIPGAGPAAGVYVGQILTVNGGGDVITVTPDITTAVVSVSATVGGFALTTFDRDTSNIDLTFKSDWAARFAFGDYGAGLMPKTVTKAIVGLKSEAGSKSLKFYRNFKTDAQMGATRNFTTLAGNHIDNIIDCNDGEGQLIAVELSALAEARAKIYFLELQGFASGIETNYGL